MIVHAASGFDRTLARYAGDRERPAPGAVFVADVLGAIFAYGAIQTALLQRMRTGTGQHVDVALMDSMLNLLVYELQEAQFPVATARPTYGPVRGRRWRPADRADHLAQFRRAVRRDRFRRTRRPIRASRPCRRAARTGPR